MGPEEGSGLDEDDGKDAIKVAVRDAEREFKEEDFDGVRESGPEFNLSIVHE